MVGVISLSLWFQLITPTSTLIILDITKPSSNNYLLFVSLLQGQSNGKVVPREPKAGDVVKWTGDGFTEVKDKATLEYAVTNVPYTGEYNILVRYEPKVHFIDHSRNITLTA